MPVEQALSPPFSNKHARGVMKMAKVTPYHTDFEEHSAESRNVYHDHDNCPDGGLILPHHRKSGNGDKPLCKKCAKMN